MHKKWVEVRNGDRVYITGSINHSWYDPYNWHVGMGVYIPKFGYVEDGHADAHDLYDHDQAHLVQVLLSIHSQRDQMRC